MFVRVKKLLAEEDLSAIDKLIAAGTFVDGKTTAGVPTREVKNNKQFDLTEPAVREALIGILNRVMNNNPMIKAAVLPRRITLPLISQYDVGMSYGWHVDNAIMLSPSGPLRTDVACTIFLSNTTDYEGGELMLATTAGDVQVKLERGDAFLYPAVSRHQVKEIKSGTRTAIVFWIQSMVADSTKREILYDLELAYDRLMKENPESESIQFLQRSQANLIRRWSDV
jgi:PKHD-type hydroxylase